MVAIACFNVQWITKFDYIALSGFPLLFVIFTVVWGTDMFPSSMSSPMWEYVQLAQLVSLFVLTEILQTWLHFSAHTWLRRTFLGRAHAVHHTVKHPRPSDAFFTGFSDALFQLIIPILLVLHVVNPTRSTAIAFGCLYSWWLLFIHSPPCEYPLIDKLKFVSPAYHHMHHKEPTRNFSHVFAFF